MNKQIKHILSFLLEKTGRDRTMVDVAIIIHRASTFGSDTSHRERFEKHFKFKVCIVVIGSKW